MSDSAQRKAEQLAYWGGAGGERWVAQQARRDAMLGDFAAVVLARAKPQPGESVIDVGCGCGETAALLAEAVGPKGMVLAVDISAPILEAARERLAGHPPVRLILGDAGEYMFKPASIDLVFSRFGVMFFADPVAAFSNLRMAAKPGARLVFACWRSPAENGWMAAPFNAAAQLLAKAEKLDPDEPGPFAFGEPGKVANIITRAGFVEPVFEKVDALINVAAGGGGEAAVRSAMELGPTARALDGADEALRAAVADALRAFFAPLVDDHSVKLPAALWIVSAMAG